MASALALFLTGVISAPADTPPIPQVPIYITNHSNLSDKKFLDALPVIQHAVSNDFAPYWGQDAQLIYIGHSKAPTGAWAITLVNYPDCLNCAGYHDVANGIPYALVGVVDMNWQIVFTHELFEMLGDPQTTRSVEANGTIYLMEAADPVEWQRYAYRRRIHRHKWVWISDFVLPSWFDPLAKGPYDFTHHVQYPLQVLKNGYQLVWKDGGWEPE